MTFAPTVVRVTLDTGLVTRLSNQVVRIVRSRAGARLMPASPPTSRSGPRFSLASVSTVPTRNWRYSSLSVGARKPAPTSPHTLILPVIWYRAAARGLTTLSALSTRHDGGVPADVSQDGLLLIAVPAITAVSRLWAS
ncbi:MAG: hypothetical protein DMF94_33120 [Acidobacteria bacterium]|nr:MAG: hypothetical protein DMF96_09780 [Acidobacteriota bacterium]PYR15065.1 MAG: hypothetical protein DMF94_33120 [Acidobacteriota bacterium]